jgi:glycosyltransferase involved in cell wall biosynthesis
MKVSIFLRKKIIGQNSLEELANNIVTGTSYSQLCIFPEYFSSIKGIIKNIIYVKKNTGDINHFFQPAGAFLCFFLRNTIVTYHDIFTLMEDKTFFQKYFRVLMYIIVPCVFAKKITCVSNITKSDLEKYAPRFSLKKIQIIYNVNMNNITYSDHKFNSNNPTILHIGTADRKNLLRLIKALSGIKCYLVIVGILSEKQTKLLE